MTSKEIRKAFLDFFASKGHKIVPSAPMVIKDDPTLMFTNAGMNQFKDIFLNLRQTESKRVADSQKCLRVSGKHNDLEEVGKDTYHHTMFEMLGNWSFGDYFKKEAIEWAWEFLTEVMHLPIDRLYATIFEGDEKENITRDTEAYNHWKRFLPESHIINGNKKDNFWEMGDTGPCGPCSEIHIDIRDDNERKLLDGAELVNKSNPLVIEIWNLVFIQYNRRQDGSLEQLPAQHVDTGMGFERLCMVTQGKKSNYDSDVFQPIIKEIERLSGFKYGQNEQINIAMRVLADHLRTISFSTADGQLPSNEKAGYVIRRILRRAVRYYFTFLNQKQPFLFKLVPSLINVLGEQYSELTAQKEFITNVILEEESAFLVTLDKGIKMIDEAIETLNKQKQTVLDGKLAFTLYDSFGFPPDLTELILSENKLTMDKKGFEINMNEQKQRSRNVVKQETDEWTILIADDVEEFVGYDNTEATVRIARYRKATVKKETVYHLVFNLTPFYGEGGGQVGDKGYIETNSEKIEIIDCQKEHNLIYHITNKLPNNLNAEFHAVIANEKRNLTACNHSATHLLHKALREVLGNHVQQKGSLVSEEGLRFDFAHYQKLSQEEIEKTEAIVNQYIRQNYILEEHRNMPISEARKLGAMALFGEKYGDTVRVIKFGDSIELCGGTHVKSTGNIGMFKIMNESAISSGVRRIEAITAVEVENYIYDLQNTINELKTLLKSPTKLSEKVEKLLDENKQLSKQVEEMQKEKLHFTKIELKNNIVKFNGINAIISTVKVPNSDILKQLSYELRGEVDNLYLVLGAIVNDKPLLSVMLGNELVEKKYNANQIIREIAKEIDGGGGGQPFYATAGGKNLQGIDNALKKAQQIIK